MDYFEQEEKIIRVLMQRLEDEKSQVLPDAVELQQFLTEQLCFLQEEKRRIQLRRRFIQNTLDELRKADGALKTALHEAANMMPSDEGMNSRKI